MRRLSLILIILSIFLGGWLLVGNASAAVKGKPITVIYGPEGVFNQPQSVFFDEHKRKLYVVDTGNNRLVSFDQNYKYLAEFTAEGRLKLPVAMVRDRADRIIVACVGEKNVLVIYLKEKKIKPLDFKNFAADVVPYRLALGKDHLYVIDRAHKQIFIFSLKGDEYTLVDQIKEKNALGFNDIKQDANYIYALDTLLKTVFIYTHDGNFVQKVVLKDVVFPVSLAVNPRGLLYVLDKQQDKVIIFNKFGNKVSEFGRPGWKEGAFYHPQYLFLSQRGDIYVVDTGNGRIQVFQLK